MTARVALVLVAALFVVAPASARRAPSAKEKRAIGSAVRGYIRMPGSPAAKDNRITSIVVSSVDPRYAAVRLSSRSAGYAAMVLHESENTWWVLEFGSSLTCDGAPTAVFRDLGVGCTPPYATAWIDDCGPLVPSPKSLTLTCADANYQLTGLRWRRWGKAVATATGAARVNDCTPSCAAGRFHSYPVTVSAAGLSRCNSARYYAQLTVVYGEKRRPAGIPKRDVHALGC